MKTSGQRLRSGILMVEDAETVMRGSAGKTAVCGRNKLGGHYGRAGLEETAAHGGQRLGGQQPMEIKMKVDGVSAESGERRMTSTYQNLRIRSLIYCKCDRTVWNLDLFLLHFFVA